MNVGAFGENFPYSNFHDLNMDWIIKIAKDFLDQYTNIQQTITDGLEGLDTKANELETLLQEWYDTHSNDIANELATSLVTLQNSLTQKINEFNESADQKTETAINSIPAEYQLLSDAVRDLRNGFVNNSIIISEVEPYTILTDSTGTTSPTTNLFYTSGYIPVTPGVTYYTKVASRTCFYNSNKTYIGSFARESSEITPPANSAYCRITWYQASANDHSQYFTTNPSTVVSLDNTNTKIKLKNILNGYPNKTIDITQVSDYTILTDSTGVASETTYLFYTTDFTPVLGNTTYYVKKASRVCFYDLNKNFVSSGPRDTTQFTTPGDAYYVRISWYYMDCPLGIQYISNTTDHKEFDLKNIRQRYDIYHTENITDFYNAMEYCYQYGNMDVYIHEGAYVYTNELIDRIRSAGKRGIRIGNNNRYYFDTASYIRCEYTGQNTEDVANLFSPLDSDNTGGNWEVNNLTLLAKNVLYGIHDESAGSDIPTTRIYNNCYLLLDNSGASTVSFDHVIGGGLAKNSLIIHNNCIYESTSNVRNRDVSYHGNTAGDYSRIIVTGCYFAHTFAFDTPFNATIRKELTMSNCSLGSAIQIAEGSNLLVHEWNNVIR